MIKYLLLWLMMSASVCAQSQDKTATKHYIGQHYGDHPSWEYYAEVRTYRNGDTLYYEQDRYNRNVIRRPENRAMIQRLTILLEENHPRVLRDSVVYGWSHKILMEHQQDSVLGMSGNTVIKEKVSNDKPFFSTLESIELYLAHTNLYSDFEQDINYGFRDFRIKVIDNVGIEGVDQKVADCYEIAVFSLDSSNVADAKLYVDKASGTLIKKEYIVNEFTAPGSMKSIGTERIVPADHQIDIASLENPTAKDYVEAAFLAINQQNDLKKARNYVDQAFVFQPNINTAQARINILAETGRADSTVVYQTVQKAIEQLDLYTNVYELNNFGRQLLQDGYDTPALYVFEKNTELHPDNFVPLVGLARFYGQKGNFKKAITYLEKSLKLNPNSANKTRIEENLARLRAGENMI